MPDIEKMMEEIRQVGLNPGNPDVGDSAITVAREAGRIHADLGAQMRPGLPTAPVELQDVRFAALPLARRINPRCPGRLPPHCPQIPQKGGQARPARWLRRKARVAGTGECVEAG